MVKNSKLIHVHIGKCAGSSINLILQKFQLPFEELHCFDANVILRERLNNDDGTNLYLISIRDPVERFVSAFNWDKYEKIIVNKTANPLWNEIYKNFTSVNDLVEALSTSNCHRRELAHKAVSASFLHMHLSVSWYIPYDIIEFLPKERTFLVRTENFFNDFYYFLKDNYKITLEERDLQKDKSSNEFLNKIGVEKPRFLSDKSREYLIQNTLAEDYRVYSVLKAL